MADFELFLNGRMYQHSLAAIRSPMARDRAAPITRIEVENGYGDRLAIYIRPFDFYMIGVDFGSGPFHFEGMPAIDGSRPLEFGASYSDLGLHRTLRPGEEYKPIAISAPKLDMGIRDLIYHQPAGRKSGLDAGHKRTLMRLIFVSSEALRNWMIARDVEAMLLSPGTERIIDTYHGPGNPLTEWKTWSREPDWPSRGIFVPHIRS